MQINKRIKWPIVVNGRLVRADLCYTLDNLGYLLDIFILLRDSRSAMVLGRYLLFLTVQASEICL